MLNMKDECLGILSFSWQRTYSHGQKILHQMSFMFLFGLEEITGK